MCLNYVPSLAVSVFIPHCFVCLFSSLGKKSSSTSQSLSKIRFSQYQLLLLEFSLYPSFHSYLHLWKDLALESGGPGKESWLVRLFNFSKFQLIFAFPLPLLSTLPSFPSLLLLPPLVKAGLELTVQLSMTLTLIAPPSPLLCWDCGITGGCHHIWSYTLLEKICHE